MPYRDAVCGIYVIRNVRTGSAYVGQSKNMRKRIADHLNLLRSGRHRNPHLQNAWNLYGEDSFVWEPEVICEDPQDLDLFENAYLSGEAAPEGGVVHYNIAKLSTSVMVDRSHTDETKRKISASKRGRCEHITPEYRVRLREGLMKSALKNPEYRARVRFVVDNPHMSYAARGRHVGFDTSTARKLALKYTPYKEYLYGTN
jgi:group I intron endonuclease